MLGKRWQSQEQNISYAKMSKMSNPELFKVLRRGLKEIPPKILKQYFEKEICVGDIRTLFKEINFKDQKYFMRLIPEKKLKNTITFCDFLYFEEFANFLSDLAKDVDSRAKSTIFQKIGNLMDSEDFISKILESLNEMALAEILIAMQDEQKILMICETAKKLGKEKQILAIFKEKINLSLLKPDDFLGYTVLYDILYQINETEFAEFYQDCSKVSQIELLENIFADKPNLTVGDKILRYQAKFVLEQREKSGEITQTEKFYLEYAKKIE